MKQPSGVKIITKNKKALFDYHIEERLEAGIVLTGSEVKSLRDGSGNLSDAYAMVKGGELFLLNSHIAPYTSATYMNHEPKRTRKLLLHKTQINKLIGRQKQGGTTLIPISLYFKNGKVKVELGLAVGKKKYDKRQTIREREDKRRTDRALRR